MSSFRVKNKDGTWDKVPVLGSYQAVLAANEAATNAQNAAKEVKEIYGDGNFTPLSDLLGSLGTKLKRWGTIFANKVFASNLPIVYNSVAEMKADTMLWEGMNTKTLGYYAPNDGGGASYLIREKLEGDVENGGRLHELANGLVAELIIENGIVNVKQFGARGDGISDDYNVFQNLIDEYNYIFVPSGNYIISEICIMKHKDLIIVGQSNATTTITCQNGFIQTQNPQASNILYIRDVTIDGINKTSSCIIGGFMNSNMQYVYFNNFDKCLEITGWYWSNKYDTCYFIGNNFGIYSSQLSNDILFSDCTFAMNTKSAVYFSATNENIKFDNCNISENTNTKDEPAVAICIGAAINMVIDNCYLEHNDQIIKFISPYYGGSVVMKNCWINGGSNIEQHDNGWLVMGETTNNYDIGMSPKMNLLIKECKIHSITTGLKPFAFYNTNGQENEQYCYLTISLKNNSYPFKFNSYADLFDLTKCQEYLYYFNCGCDVDIPYYVQDKMVWYISQGFGNQRGAQKIKIHIFGSISINEAVTGGSTTLKVGIDRAVGLSSKELGYVANVRYADGTITRNLIAFSYYQFAVYNVMPDKEIDRVILDTTQYLGIN